MAGVRAVEVTIRKCTIFSVTAEEKVMKEETADKPVGKKIDVSKLRCALSDRVLLPPTHQKECKISQERFFFKY